MRVSRSSGGSGGGLALDANSYSRVGKAEPASTAAPATASPSPSMLADLAKDPNLQGSPGVSHTAPFFFGAYPAILHRHFGIDPATTNGAAWDLIDAC